MVIQRWQTLLLLVAGAVMAWFSFVSIGQVNTEDFTLQFFPLGFKFDGEYDNPAFSGWYVHTWSFFILSILSSLIPLAAIFCYKNLRLQKRLCLMTCLFLCAAVAAGASYGYNTIADSSVSWNQMCFSPLLAFCATVFAWSLIRSDERRIAAADRIR